MNRLVITLFVITCSIKGFSQKVVFDLNANFVYPLPYESLHSVTDTNDLTVSIINGQDTTFLRYQNIYRYNSKVNYEPDLGVEIFGRFTIPISNRFSVLTGIGLSYYSFRSDDDRNADYITTLSVDTVESLEQIDFPGPIFTCDCYENSIEEVIHADFRKYYQHLNLMIPVSVDFAVIPGRLSAGVGVFSQIPVYASLHRKYISIDSYEMDDMTKCKYVLEESQNNSGDGIRHFQGGISAAVKIGFLPNLSLEIGARKLLTNVFVNPENQAFSFYTDDFSPVYLTAGVSYIFHKPNSSEY